MVVVTDREGGIRRGSARQGERERERDSETGSRARGWKAGGTHTPGVVQENKQRREKRATEWQVTRTCDLRQWMTGAATWVKSKCGNGSIVPCWSIYSCGKQRRNGSFWIFEYCPSTAPRFGPYDRYACAPAACCTALSTLCVVYLPRLTSPSTSPPSSVATTSCCSRLLYCCQSVACVQRRA